MSNEPKNDWLIAFVNYMRERDGGQFGFVRFDAFGGCVFHTRRLGTRGVNDLLGR